MTCNEPAYPGLCGNIQPCADHPPVSRAEFELLCQMVELLGSQRGSIFDEINRQLLTASAHDLLYTWAEYRFTGPALFSEA